MKELLDQQSTTAAISEKDRLHKGKTIAKGFKSGRIPIPKLSPKGLLFNRRRNRAAKYYS